MSGEAIWSFALGVYGAPGVPEMGIALQDEAGADVDILLWCAWAGTQGVALGAEAIAAAVAATRPWRDGVVRPLRGVRRTMKDMAVAAPPADVAALRAGVKAAELEAERLELAMLARLLPADRPPAPARDAVAANLADYLATLGIADPDRTGPLLSAALRAV
ncbi:MAG: TIGR02444 family protein [Alphaproteobacteria bacterium]|nr:TIGR02444 family protein [Alphaproteobacteria bacterium]